MLVPTFNDLILFPTRGVFLSADAMGEDATANLSLLCQMKNGSVEIQYSFFTQEKENKEMLVILMRSKKGGKQKRKKPYDTHLHVTLKVAYHRMFWLVSGKGRRRPFCPDDEWAGLTGHFSLPLSLSLSFPRSLRPFLFLLPLHHPLRLEATICSLRPGARRRIPPGDRFIGIGTR